MNDLVIPDSAVSAAAVEVASGYLSAAMVSHSHRVYLWAAGFGKAEGVRYDDELLFVAAMFHDLSLVPVFDSHTVAFEEASGHLARVFAAGAGWPTERRERLGEAIVGHMRFDVGAAADPEGHLLSRAAALDIAGKDLDAFSPAFRADVLRQYPRLGLADEFLACFQDQAARKPSSSAARAVQSGLAARVSANPLDR